MHKLPQNTTCWILTEGMAGTENQCRGIAEAMGIEPKVIRISLNWPWSLLSPYIGLEHSEMFTPRLDPPWPDILIASGRKSIAASRYIKKMSGGKTFTVQVQDPRVSTKNFDLLAIPAHDPSRGANVLVTTATPNRITPARLAKAREEFKAFENIKQPRVAVLIGGSSQAYTLDQQTMHTLAEQLKHLDAGLMITTSRRTGKDNEKILNHALKDSGHFIWDGHGDNPYFGMLAWADVIMVTADSASMLSEAATTGKPVYMIDLKGGKKRMRLMQQNLIHHGAVKTFNGELEQWSYEPLNDAEKVATEIAARFQARG